MNCGFSPKAYNYMKSQYLHVPVHLSLYYPGTVKTQIYLCLLSITTLRLMQLKFLFSNINLP